jgi:hypothetical protein
MWCGRRGCTTVFIGRSKGDCDFIKPDIAETYAPVDISVAYGGQNPVPRQFIMVLVWIHTAKGWKMTTDIPIPVPPDQQRSD